jgi:hypothetical protein
VIYFHRRNPLRKCNLPNRIKRIGQPDGHAGWTVASNVSLPPPPHVLHIKETRFVHPGTSGERIRLSNWFARPDWMFQLNAGEKINSWRYSKIVVGSMRSVSQKRIPVSTRLLTLDRSFFLVSIVSRVIVIRATTTVSLSIV